MRRRSPTERFAAWLVTGPLGHLQGGAADLVEVLWALACARVRVRAGRGGRRRAWGRSRRRP